MHHLCIIKPQADCTCLHTHSQGRQTVDLCNSSLLLNFSSCKITLLCEYWELAPCAGHSAPGTGQSRHRGRGSLNVGVDNKYVSMCHQSSSPSLNLGARLRLVIMVFPFKDFIPRSNDRLDIIFTSNPSDSEGLPNGNSASALAGKCFTTTHLEKARVFQFSSEQTSMTCF